MSDNKIGQEFTTNLGNVLKIISVCGRTSSRSKLYSVSCSICNEDRELYPDPFITTFYDMKRGKIPCGCSKKPILSENQRTILATRKCNELGYTFIGFKNGYHNAHSNMEYICPYHGIHITSYNNLMNLGVKCPSCYKEERRRTNEENSSKEIKRICIDKGYIFYGYQSGYTNAHSKFLYSCSEHGVQISSHHKFVNKMCGCGCCAINGYSISKPGYFYIFKYKKIGGDTIYKYGITNRDPDIRSKEHIKNVDIELNQLIYSSYHDDGSIPLELENKIKLNRTGVCDWLFSGNTETFPEKDLNSILSIIRDFT